MDAALAAAYHFDWRPDAAKVAVFVADAPPHADRTAAAWAAVEASRARLEKLIARHELLQHFYHNEWVHLAALDPDDGTWYSYMPWGVWRRIRKAP